MHATLAAVYATRAPALRRRAAAASPDGAHAWDVLQDAFLFVLEHPPADTSERALGAALDHAVRVVCSRDAKRASDDRAMRVALRKRSV